MYSPSLQTAIIQARVEELLRARASSQIRQGQPRVSTLLPLLRRTSRGTAANRVRP